MQWRPREIVSWYPALQHDDVALDRNAQADEHQAYQRESHAFAALLVLQTVHVPLLFAMQALTCPGLRLPRASPALGFTCTRVLTTVDDRAYRPPHICHIRNSEMKDEVLSETRLSTMLDAIQQTSHTPLRGRAPAALCTPIRHQERT